ncbi:ABC transporter ATP-binding protein [Paradevosia shaoguanensis]|uniref:ABC transporter ATP-binding protein n=1 Tax=Paradevosia shaoguanensis TaxID=1335043 RepID=A0AA41UC73_9HYPH|nr:ABC transporter ATP-binding protein [Paradevosia shaoguanensis]MCF1741516.1 ABC transporter ATP-binding protein [Paradevosia shaoguanensis]MCI0125999.1 ABC transporter ATP-binding protein [Paradevosia shaoguanensis]
MTSADQSVAAAGLVPAAVDMRDIRVQFGPVIANDAVDFAVRPGEIHALLGENGAGKTTLMRILAGLLQPQRGEVLIDGKPVHLASALDAQAHGIGMVHQHFMLIPTMSVAENISIGLPGVRRWFPRLGDLAREISAFGKERGLEIDANALAGSLSVAGQQRAEILKALYRGSKILILDEPTAVLTPQEATGLFEVLRSLARAGTAIIFISHKLHEVMAVTDRITVLRRGKVAASFVTRDTNEREVARAMVGADVTLPQLDEPANQNAAPILDLSALTLKDERGLTRLDDVTLTIRSGEIVGIAGVDGNGQQELAEAVVGLRRLDSGAIAIDGKPLAAAPVADRIAAGLAHIPEDRHRTAIFSPMSIAENAASETIGAAPLSRSGLIDNGALRTNAEAIVENFDVRCSGIDQPIGELSGGNQQKVVLGRAMSRDPRLVVAVQPTRGLDIGATAFLHNQLLESRRKGAAVMLVSTELDEILALSDRIAVMFKGRIIGIIERKDVTMEKLGLMLAGKAA